MCSSTKVISGIRPLKTQFRGRGEVKGYLYTQISQTDSAYIFKASSGNRKHYEVFLKKVNRRFACISYPKSRAFGIWAWTYMNLEKAERKFKELNQLKKQS